MLFVTIAQSSCSTLKIRVLTDGSRRH